MMKKYFSLTLLLAMVLTLVSTIPAQAALDNTYPYVFLDYNASVGAKGNGNEPFVAKSEWAENEGVGGTGALKVTDKNKLNDDNLATAVLKDTESIKRDSYKISGWVKFVSANKLDAQGNTILGSDGNPEQWEFKTPLTNLRLGVNFTYNLNPSGTFTSGRNAVGAITPDLTDHKWHYFETEFVQQNVSSANTTPNYAKAFPFTDHGKPAASGGTYPYDWTVNETANFGIRFISNAGSSSQFKDIFNGFDANAHQGELICYLDDFQYTPYVSATTMDGSVPVVTINGGSTSLASNIAGETVNISWTHAATNTGITNVKDNGSKVVVRVFKKVFAGANTDYADNGWVLVDQQFATGNSFNYPLTEAMLGDYYKFEVFPYDEVVDLAGKSTYRAGAIKTVEMTNPVSKGEIITPKAGTPITFTSLGTGSGGKITFELTEVRNNRTTTLDLFTIIALYDDTGALIDCHVNDLAPLVGVGSLPSLALTHTVTLGDDAAYNEVASAKAFVWGGSAIGNPASHKAYTTVSTATKP